LSDPYAIEFTAQAKKEFLKLDKIIQIRVKNALLRIRVRPFYYIKRLVGQSSYRLRAGDYRIIMDVKKKTLLILVIKIKHRKNIYKEL
jgi:mRNA interferase RelE/StbE